MSNLLIIITLLALGVAVFLCVFLFFLAAIKSLD